MLSDVSVIFDVILKLFPLGPQSCEFQHTIMDCAEVMELYSSSDEFHTFGKS